MDVEVQKQGKKSYYYLYTYIYNIYLCEKVFSLFLMYNLNNKVIHSPARPALEDWIIMSFDIF